MENLYKNRKVAPDALFQIYYGFCSTEEIKLKNDINKQTERVVGELAKLFTTSSYKSEIIPTNKLFNKAYFLDYLRSYILRLDKGNYSFDIEIDFDLIRDYEFCRKIDNKILPEVIDIITNYMNTDLANKLYNDINKLL